MVEVIDVSSNEEAEEKAVTRNIPVKDDKPPMSPVQYEVDWDLLEAEIEEEEAVAEAKNGETSSNISVKGGKTPAASYSPSSCYSGEDGWRE